MLSDIEHIQVDYARDRYAGHPRQGGIFNYGGGEIAILYNRAPCAYRVRTDISHSGLNGYISRAQVILARSYDYGRTWERGNDQVVFDHTAPADARRAWVLQGEDDLTAQRARIDLTARDTATAPEAKSAPRIVREQIDLRAHDTAIYFGRTHFGEADLPVELGLSFSLRSRDRGKTWEKTPTPVHPPAGYAWVHKDGHPLVQMPDGTQLAAMTVQRRDGLGGVHLYGSDDNGLSWEPLARIASDPTGDGRPTYAGLLLLPSGRLQAYTLHINGWRDAIQMNYSDDGGYSWSEPKPIVRWGQSPWVSRRSANHDSHGPTGKFYRSPWPLRLADGRTIVIFGRRKLPYGMGVIISEDDGQTWSPEQVLRADAATPDLGYPVATEVAAGRIFTAFYYTLDDGNGFGGTRFIAGSAFTVR
jgi:hypothetical protein